MKTIEQLQVIKILLDKILADSPAPWHYEKHHDKAISIKSSNGSDVLYKASFTGDGDCVYISDDSVIALIDLVNMLYKETQGI